MNGIVFIEIGKFAHSRLGERAWRELVRLAGVAGHYAEQVAITEPSCMLKGDAACRLIVKCRPL